MGSAFSCQLNNSSKKRMLENSLTVLGAWLAITHTVYSISFISASAVLPFNLGKAHMFADTIGHGVSCVYLKNPLSGIFCAWHVIKYFTNLTQLTPESAYSIDILDMFLWQIWKGEDMKQDVYFTFHTFNI